MPHVYKYTVTLLPFLSCLLPSPTSTFPSLSLPPSLSLLPHQPSSSSPLTHEERLAQQHYYGIHYTDDYNYLQHLKEPGTAVLEPGTAVLEPGTAVLEPGTAVLQPAMSRAEKGEVGQCTLYMYMYMYIHMYSTCTCMYSTAIT